MKKICKEVVFHFNKGHLKDPTIPMWVIKTGGQSYYINHLTADCPWTTKETPDNEHTKGSLKFKDALLVIDSDNNATLSRPTPSDRAAERKQNGVRIVTSYPNKLMQILRDLKLKHSPIKTLIGTCGNRFGV